MTEKIILYTIIGIAVAAALAFLTKATGRAIAIDHSGYYNLRMNKLYGILGFVGLLFGLLFLIFLPMTGEADDSGMWIALVLMLLIFWGAGIPCIMYYRNHSLSFNDKSIIASNVYGAFKEIKWCDITDIQFKAMSGLLVLTTKEDENIKVHQHLVGLSQFIEHIEANTKWSRKDLKIPLGK